MKGHGGRSRKGQTPGWVVARREKVKNASIIGNIMIAVAITFPVADCLFAGVVSIDVKSSVVARQGLGVGSGRRSKLPHRGQSDRNAPLIIRRTQ